MESQHYVLSVNQAEGSDDFLKKLKMATESSLKGLTTVIKVGGNSSALTVQVYPLGWVLSNVTLESIPLIVAALVAQNPAGLESLMCADAPYEGNLARLLRANMTQTELKICGKCCPCRLGGPRIGQVLEGLAEGSLPFTPAVAEQLQEVGFAMKNASMCMVGMFGADPLLFCLTHFKNDLAPNAVKGA